MSCILEDVIEATTNNNGYKCRLNINGEYLDTEHVLIFNIAFVIGDTLAHDKLVCLKKGANTGKNLYRVCEVSFDDTDNEYLLPKYTRMDNLIGIIESKNYSKVQSLGYWPLPENPFFKMGYLDEERGINGSTPSESLHFILQGYFIYALSQFVKMRNSGGCKGNYIFGF